MYMYMNGKILKENEAFLSPFDHGFLYGLGLFETFRIYDGHAFLLDDHIARINQGMKEMNILHTFSRHAVQQMLTELLVKNGLSHARIRLNVSAGEAPVGLQTLPYERPNILLFMQEVTIPAGLQEKTGFLLKTRRNTPETSQRLKSHHYLNNIAAKRELKIPTEAEGIFLTEGGFLAEGIVSNLFWVKQGVLFTPSIETGILNGITRQFLIKLAGGSGIKVQEGLFNKEDLADADEVFCTNSVQEIFSISQIEGIGVYPGRNGKMANILYDAYQNYRTLLYSRCEI
ncbi:aminodeoxychorismate lyase [Peribacillus glennii]|uniref:4-amino-4-deoxychorismate lyase n=1 Tax=Peribacillus glennii TaxID=2303991 RepID=A0A372LBB4_9BACI|nr:aminodeoxychorismate lyase [Peribacillus glennii]RFU62663.1 4-amino-4-deoxychorismate lyase [Peribacillus glennii]